MKIEIKKFHLTVIISFICLITGFALFNLFFRALVESGWFGFITLGLFLISLVGTVNCFLEYRFKIKIIEEVSREIAEKELKMNPDKFRYDSMETLKNKIEAHLVDKVDNEKLVL